ncbi:Putative serine-threonine protein kinase 19 [Septoria linicola]|uniref:Serine-threonine protein kinase 19 n=1 Tax=Septoria linicola TaxID=215465 RepID=A0A9Q9AYL2_9PEZI|nr:Putative serine-threonine protein kinase 19 [Septoria linicola]
MPKTPNPLLRRKSSSPFTTAQRTKPGLRKSSTLPEKELDHNRLDDLGIIARLPTSSRQDVVSLIRHVLSNAFEEIPDRAAGMNSKQISETLQYRARLPPIVSIAHIHALSVSTTETERQLARLVAEGKLRKVTIPGRGKGGTAVGEGVVIVEDWKERLLRGAVDLEADLKQKYIALMQANPASQTASVVTLDETDVKSLVEAGFLTNPAALSSTVGNLFARPTGVAAGPIATAGHTAVTGTFAAVGGYGAIHDSGGGGSTLATQHNRSRNEKTLATMTLSLPGTGSYLKLLTEARQHLLFLLKQLSPRFKEATRDLLEEKWNGNVLGDATSQAKRMRGEWSGVLAGQTRRWKQFYGLQFEWVLAECLGSGLVELFDTGSVGVGVRAI